MRDLIGGAITIYQRRGFKYLKYLFSNYLVPVSSYRLFYGPLRGHHPRRVIRWFLIGIVFLALTALLLVTNWLTVGLVGLALAGAAFLVILVARKRRELRHYRLAKKLLQQAGAARKPGTFTSWTQLLIDPSYREEIEAARRAQPTDHIAIGRVDQEGRVHNLHGEKSGRPAIGTRDHAKQADYVADAVLIGDDVLICKDYKNDRAKFINEWFVLAHLAGKVNVPAIHHVDEERSRLYVNMIKGRPLKSFFSEESTGEASLHEPGTNGHQEVAFGHNSHSAEGLTQKVADQLDLLHSAGVTRLSGALASILVSDDGTPWFTSLESARLHRSATGMSFRYERDQDRLLFNRLYDQNLLTEVSARKALTSQRAKLSAYRDYAPIDFGQGLAFGSFYTTDSGTGRWEFFNRGVVAPLVLGKRVLDLGSNNGSLPLMMLRNGAKEVVGVERSKVIANFARTNNQVLEWCDMRKYAFQLHNCDMLDVLREDWGKFDVVTAFCSLYYVTEEDMANVVRRCAELAPVMVVQGNTGFARERKDDAKKASSEYLQKLLQDNGYPRVEVFNHHNFARPIVIGRR